MAAERYRFSGVSSDGFLLIEDMSHTHERGLVALTFYSDEDLTTQVTPGAGTAIITVSEDGANFGTVLKGTVDATKVGTAVQYDRPNWSGSTRYLKVTFLGITTATHCRIDVARYGE